MACFGNAVDISMSGKLIEHGMHGRVTERAEISDFDPKASKGVRHDRAIATQLYALVDQFNVSAATGGSRDAVAQG